MLRSRLAFFTLALWLSACSAPAPPPPPPTTGAASPSPLARPASPGPAASPALSPVAVAPVPSPSPIAQPSPSAEPAAVQVPISPYPFAVMVDNIAEARPQSGLGAADVVYEAPAEGGIPRLMPVFLSGNAGRIGPIRSARHYFVELAAEFGAALVHIGASPQGFQMMEQLGTVRVDEARGDGGFTRDPRLLAPHNAFASSDAVRAELQKRGAKLEGTTAGLRWGAFQPGSAPATSIAIRYPGGERYVASYQYEAEAKRYLRSMDGRPHVDGVTGERYAARSVIVQYVPVALIPGDDAGRLEVSLVGTGDAMLFAEGTQVPLTWSKDSLTEATRFRRDDGNAFVLPEGQTWVQIVPLETVVEIGG